MANQLKKHTISLLMSNKPGVLTRVALVFTRRGFNIDSLVVSEGQTSKFSRMTIEATGNSKTLHLMLAQLNRLVDVVHAVDHVDDDVIQRELALFKVHCPPEKRLEILQTADAFRTQTVDIGEDTITFQVTGKSKKIDAFKDLMKPFKIYELVRTGKVLMSRGSESTA